MIFKEWEGKILQSVLVLNDYINKFAPLASIKRATMKLLGLHGYLNYLTLIRINDQIKMYVPLRFVSYYRNYEPFVTALFKQVLRPGLTVLDIGAHLGYYSLIAADRVGPSGKVFAFEPALDSFLILQQNILLNRFSNIVAIQKAVAEVKSTRVLYRGEWSTSDSLYPLPVTTSKLVVDCITIDEFLDEFLDDRSIDIIKMDIEGGEMAALKGMRETISRSRELSLFLECNPPRLAQAGVTIEQLLSLLEDYTFQVSLIDESSGKLLPISKLDSSYLESRYNDPSHPGNLYCVKR
jgi:FkbM family methyltransferase